MPNAERYDARYEGKKGFVYLMSAKGGKQARVSFITGPPLAEPSASVSATGHSDPQVLWSLDVGEVVKLVKHSGYGPTVVNSKTMRYVDPSRIGVFWSGGIAPYSAVKANA